MIKSNSFQRKDELITTLFFYCSLLFAIEAIFISEQIVECRFGALLEISEKFSSNLNVFCYMILKCWLHYILESFITILYDFDKHSGSVVLSEWPEFLPQNNICLVRERDVRIKI